MSKNVRADDWWRVGLLSAVGVVGRSFCREWRNLPEINAFALLSTVSVDK